MLFRIHFAAGTSIAHNLRNRSFSHRSPEQQSARWLRPTPGRYCAVKKLVWCMLFGAALTLHFNTGIWSQDAKDGPKVVPPPISPPALTVKQDAPKPPA